MDPNQYFPIQSKDSLYVLILVLLQVVLALWWKARTVRLYSRYGHVVNALKISLENINYL